MLFPNISDFRILDSNYITIPHLDLKKIKNSFPFLQKMEPAGQLNRESSNSGPMYDTLEYIYTNHNINIS